MAETTPSMSEQLADLQEVQRNILTVLNLLLETNEAQTEMLADILAAAAQEAGPSPVAEVLKALVATVDRLAENQATLIMQIVDLPGAIGRQLKVSLRERAAEAAEP